MTKARTTYPSDLTEKQWRQIEQLLPLEKWGGRPRSVNFREVLNAIIYREEIGCSWRMLPHDFPHWNTVYAYYRRWRNDGTLAALVKILNAYTFRRNHPLLKTDAQSPAQSV